MKKHKLILGLITWLLLSNLCQAQLLISNESKGKLTVSEIESLLGGVISVDYGVQLYKLRYTTTDVRGLPDTASGLLVIPDLPGAIFPPLVFQRGTIDNRLDVPSNLMDA